MPRMSDQRRRGGDSHGKKARTQIKGMYDRFHPNEIPTWIQISPYSEYHQEVYDRDERAVVAKVTTWYEYNNHYLARNKNKTDRQGRRLETDMICSTGPHRSLPCYPCSERIRLFKELDAIEEKKGVRPDKKPVVSRSSRFGLAVTIKEWIYAIPLRDKKTGLVRKSKATGEIIYRYEPGPRAEANSADDDLHEYSRAFGHNAHWSMGTEDLDSLLSFDEKLKNRCGNCTSDLFATRTICPGCEIPIEIGKEVHGIDLELERKKARSCRHCGEKGPFVPELQCAECGDAAEGSLLAFDLRITRVKINDTTYKTDIVEIRLPGAGLAEEDNARAIELVQNPLDLSGIYAPTSLDQQKYIMGELAQNLDPSLCVKRDTEETNTETESYTEDSANDPIEF